MTDLAATALTEHSGADAELELAGKQHPVLDSGSDFLSGFARLDVLRQIGLMVGLAVSVALGFAVVLWSQGESYQPIYGNMEGYDSSLIMQSLEAEGADFRVDPASGVILVASDKVASLRLRLAAAGVSRYDGTGYEILDEDVGLGTSKYMEANRVKRSQEGELQRTIMGFRNVQSARVHIAIPERSVFVRDNLKPSASVFLVLNSGASLSESEIRAISNLVASSVPELMSEDVTVVDQRGRLLSETETETTLDIADRQFNYIRKYEQSLLERINGLLLPLVGVDGFRAQVTADIDFTRSEAANEVFDPSVQVVRAEQGLVENTPSSAVASGIPGALTNQPPLDGQAPELVGEGTATEAGVSDRRREEYARSYEMGRSISYTDHDPVSVERVSVAVILDNRIVTDEAGLATAVPWENEALQQVETLVKSAVGFREERGDNVSVMNNSFTTVEVLPPVTTPLWQQGWVASAARQLAAGLLVLLLVMLVLRPVLKNLSTAQSESRDLALVASHGDFAELDVNEQTLADEDVQLTTAEDGFLPGPNDGYDRQINAVKGLVSEDPGRVAQVVKQWVSNNGE